MVSRIILCAFLSSFFLCAYSKHFIALTNNSSDDVYFADIESKTGDVKVVGKPFSGLFNRASYDRDNQVYAVNGVLPDAPESPLMLYTFLESGIPSQTHIVFADGLNILDHAFQSSTNRSIVVTSNSPPFAPYPNVTVWAVDMESFESTMLFEIALENITFPPFLGIEVDHKDRLFILANDGEMGGFISYSLKTGKFLKKLFGMEFGVCSSLASINETLYCLSIIDLISIDLKSGIARTLAYDWCDSGQMWLANAGFDKKDETAYVIMDCSGASTWYTMSLANGTVTSITNDQLADIYGPFPF